jgi:hypothetical protein
MSGGFDPIPAALSDPDMDRQVARRRGLLEVCRKYGISEQTFYRGKKKSPWRRIAPAAGSENPSILVPDCGSLAGRSLLARPRSQGSDLL